MTRLRLLPVLTVIAGLVASAIGTAPPARAKEPAQPALAAVTAPALVSRGGSLELGALDGRKVLDPEETTFTATAGELATSNLQLLAARAPEGTTIDQATLRYEEVKAPAGGGLALDAVDNGDHTTWKPGKDLVVDSTGADSLEWTFDEPGRYTVRFTGTVDLLANAETEQTPDPVTVSADYTVEVTEAEEAEPAAGPDTQPEPADDSADLPTPSPSGAPEEAADVQPTGTPAPDELGDDLAPSSGPAATPSPAAPGSDGTVPSPSPSPTGSATDSGSDPDSGVPATPSDASTDRISTARAAAQAEEGIRQLVLSRGHIDLFEVTWADDQVRLSVKDDTNLYDTGAQYRTPADVSLWVDSERSAQDVSGLAGTSLGFLTVGGTVSTVHLLPQSQDQELPWPGWSTERLTGSLPDGVELPNSGTPVQLAVDVDGPGEVFTWMSDTFGAPVNKYIDTVDPGADVIPVARNAHVHTNWAFTAAGDYYLTLTPTATTTTGEILTGDAAVYHLHIGPIAEAAPTAATAPTLTGETTVGAQLTLSPGGWYPTPHQVSQQWLRDGDPIDGATGLRYTTTEADRGHAISARITATIGGAGRTAETTTLQIGEPAEEPPGLEPTSFQSFTATPAAARYGGSIRLTATVNPRGGTADAPLGVGGMVEFYLGDTKLGETAITNLRTSQATFTTTAAALGEHTYRARYLPPATHASSESAPATVTVSPATTSVAVAASLAEAAVGQEVTVGAAVTPSWATGDVQILSGDLVVAEGPVADGRFQATVTELPAGAHQLSASFTSAVPEALDSASLPTASAQLAIVEGAPRGTWARTVVDHEHVDAFSVRLDGTSLVLGTRIDLDRDSKTSLPKYGNNREYLDPAGVVFHLPDRVSTGLGTPGGRKTVPDNPNYAFLGEPGEVVWIAPASSDSTPFLYAGFESESIAAGVLRDDRIDLHLVGVETPDGGRFEAYSGALTPSASPWRMLSSTDAEYSSTPFATGTHQHFSWAFTTPGTYLLQVKATATLADGTPVESEVIDYTWVIGALTNAPVVTVDADAGTAGSARLVAQVAPAATGHVEFRTTAGTLLGYAPVTDGTATLAVGLAAGRHTIAATFQPEALDRYVAAASAATEVTVAAGDPGPDPGEPVWDVPNGTRTDSGATILNTGHVDVASLIQNGRLITRVKDTTESSTPTWRVPEQTLFQALPDSRTTVPASSDYRFLGAAGDPVWLLPETQDPALLWPGWSTEEIPDAATSTTFDWTLTDVSGPGEFALFTSGGFGVPNVHFNTRDGLPDTMTIGKRVHVHGSWAFSAEGTYCLAFTRSTTLTGGTPASDEFTLAVAVGEVDLTKVDPATCFAEDEGKPTAPDTVPVPDAQLTDATTGGVQVLNGANGFSAGQLVTVQVDRSRAGQWVSVWLHSTPSWLGWVQVGASGTLQVRLPAAATAGGHPLVVKDRDGGLIGWDSLRVNAASNPVPDPDPGDDDDDQPPAGVWNVRNGTVNSAGATVLNDGHIDIASLIEQGKLVTRVKDTTESSTPAWRDPAKTVLQLLPTSKTVVPASSSYSFLGKAGSPLWQVSHTQQPGLLWPGWSTETIPVSATTGGVTWALTDMSGPGDFFLYMPSATQLGGVDVLFNTRNGITGADQFTIPKLTHAHGSWAFTAQGTYCLAMERAARLANGKTVSDQFTLAVAVGTADVMSVNPARCGETVSNDPGKTPPVKPPADDSDDKDEKKEEPAARKVAAKQCLILSKGHIDYSSRIVDGKLESLIGDDTSGTKVFREPSGVVMWLKPASQVTLTSGYGKVGKAGSTVWQVPQSQNPDLIWLGWSTEALNAGNSRGDVTWKLNSVSGPGSVKVWLQGPFGGVQTMVLNGSGSSHDIALGVHAHGNWSFSRQGTYRLRMTQTVTLANGKRSSDTETVTIAVGNVDPASACSGGKATVTTTADGTTTTALQSALQAALPPGVTADGGLPAGQAGGATAPVPGGGGGEPGQTGGATPGGASRVPLLLNVLGGLLLAGAAGSGGLWWWRRGLRSSLSTPVGGA